MSYADLLDRLSPTLRGEVVLQMSKKTLETVWYLRSCEPAFLVELAVLMQREGAPPRLMWSTPTPTPNLHSSPSPNHPP